MTPQQEAVVYASRQRGATDLSMVLNNGVTNSIRSEAMLTDGTRAVLRATMRLQQGKSGTQPYLVLRWQEGDEE